VPGVGAGAVYKYEIRGADDVVRTKADPMARRTECPPNTASVVDESGYTWSDTAWMEQRAASNPHDGPMSIYEVHLGSWRQGLSYADLAEHLVNYVSDLGFTHVEFLPVMEHPYGPSWGYQVTGYFAPTARFGAPDDFRYLVDRLHQAGIGVILDWVPGHFPRDAFALARFDGLPLYEHPDPRRGDQPDWGTHVFDFGRLEVRNFLVANATYWLEEFHVDGLRVDAVASMLYRDYSRKAGEWVPNKDGGRENYEAIDVLRSTNITAYGECRGIMTIAEESTAFPGVSRPANWGGLGFGFKWNMGWMNDTLSYMQKDPIYRKYHHHQMTFGLVYAWSENYVLPISHDEVVHGKGSMLSKMPGNAWEKFANLRAYYGFMWAHPGKKLLFMGQEFAQGAEWNHNQSLDWHQLDIAEHRGMQRLVRDLNRVYRETRALHVNDTRPEGFEWIESNDAEAGVYAWVRKGIEGDKPVVAVVNMTPLERKYRLGLPLAGKWSEILNTDAEAYGGGNRGNLGGVATEKTPWHGQSQSALVSLPPLSAVYLQQD
jgi:1,4-alpha-glucan branching enzyme